MSAPGDRYFISVPASSANLGPGFDAVAIALALRMRATVEPAARLSITFSERGRPPSHDGLASLMIRAMRRAHPQLPAVHVHVQNDIPLGKGFGSSAAATVLAIAVALRSAGKRAAARDIGRIATAIEGHPDNALAASLGGAVIAAGATQFIRLRCSRLVQPLLVVPEIELDTNSARLLLPRSYDRADVVYTVQRAAMLGAALASGDIRHLREAMRDRMHQPYRAARIPGLLDALEVRDADLAGIALSGAGPSVLAFVRAGGGKGVAAKLRAAFTRAGVQSYALPLAFCDRALQIRPLATEAAHAA